MDKQTIRKLEKRFPLIRAWFALTMDERLFLAGILTIALIGVTARYFHLKNLEPVPYHPEELTSTHHGGTR